MERVNYSKIIQEILKRHSYNDLDNGTEVQLIFDTENHHYQVVHLGWHEQRRVYGCIIHVDLKHDKIWIQRVAAGVPKHDIVLGFQAPYKRQFTEFYLG